MDDIVSFSALRSEWTIRPPTVFPLHSAEQRMAAKKELIVTSLGEDGYVEVSATDTLTQVRALILEELDEEQLPVKEFSFKVNGIRISAKQEERKLAFDLLEAKIELVPKSIKRTAEESSLQVPENNKRTKISSYVTPREENEAGQQKPPCEPLVLDERLASDDDGLPKIDEKNDDESMPQKEENNADLGPAVTMEDDASPNSTKGREESSLSVPSPDVAEGVTDRPEGEMSSTSSNMLTTEESEQPHESTNDDNDIQIVKAENPHKESNEAREKSNQVLDNLKALLQENPLFCSDTRRQEWLQEIQNLQEKSTPQTVIGVLGNTGV